MSTKNSGVVSAMGNVPFNNLDISKPERWFSIVGDNGMCLTKYPFYVIEALQKLIFCEVIEVSSESQARRYACERYIARFFSRNQNLGIQPCVPMNLPPDTLWVDNDYENRENRLKTNAENRI